MVENKNSPIISLPETVNFDALEKEVAEINQMKKRWDKASDRLFEIFKIVADHEKEYCEWKKKKGAYL